MRLRLRSIINFLVGFLITFVLSMTLFAFTFDFGNTPHASQASSTSRSTFTSKTTRIPTTTTTSSDVPTTTTTKRPRTRPLWGKYTPTGKRTAKAGATTTPKATPKAENTPTAKATPKYQSDPRAVAAEATFQFKEKLHAQALAYEMPNKTRAIVPDDGQSKFVRALKHATAKKQEREWPQPKNIDLRKDGGVNQNMCFQAAEALLGYCLRQGFGAKYCWRKFLEWANDCDQNPWWYQTH